MPFTKGHKLWKNRKNFGFSEEGLKRLSESSKNRTGIKASNWKGGIEERVKRGTLSECIDCKKVIQSPGKRCCECHYKYSKGKNHPSWQGGKTKFSSRIRNWKAYKDWQKEVFERDDYTCQDCSSKKELHSHHIKPVSTHPELVFELSNGKTLCKTCHRKYNFNQYMDYKDKER